MRKIEFLNNFGKLGKYFQPQFFNFNLIEKRFIGGLRRGFKFPKNYHKEKEAHLEGLT